MFSYCIYSDKSLQFACFPLLHDVIKNQDLGTSRVFISNRISKKIICNAVSYNDLYSGNNRNLFFFIALKKEPMANIPRSIC